MNGERFLVTGGSGCIGAWVLRNLIKEGITCANLDKGDNVQRLRLILSQNEMGKITFYREDVSDLDHVWQVFEAFRPTHVIHLAALQLPFCKADPVLGSRVNVSGTVVMFEGCKRAGIRTLVYASSTAVYGTSEEYPSGVLSHDAALLPRSHYGVYKQANEGTARVYWLDDHIASIGLRPYVVYGPGRDQGMTSTPTIAMLAAAAGQAYHVSYGGRYCFQYADDVARTFIQSARARFDGAEAFNIGGASVSTAEVISAIEQELPDIRGQITFEDTPLPFPPEVDNAALEKVIGGLNFTPLQRGVSESIHFFQQALSSGLLTPPEKK
jgi:UDP-glucuronate 4-epimerase